MLNYTFSLVDFEILILILVRISCFVYAAPFFGMKNVPSRVKIGIMAKVAPQMNMFAVGMQMKVLLGLTVLFLTVMLLPGISDFVFKEMKRMIVSMIEGMY